MSIFWKEYIYRIHTLLLGFRGNLVWRSALYTLHNAPPYPHTHLYKHLHNMYYNCNSILDY